MPKSVTTGSFEKKSGRSGSGSVRLTVEPVRNGPGYLAKSRQERSSLGNPFTGRKARASGGDTR